MILPDHQIRHIYNRGFLRVDPVPDWSQQLQPASLDLRMGDQVAEFHGGGPIDLHSTDLSKEMHTRTLEQGYLFIRPGQFVLATTLEMVALPGAIVARVEGRSSYGRLGLIVHATAGFIDPGFEGQITLEMTNISNRTLKIYAGDRICQLCFMRMSDPPSAPYRGKYQGQQGVTVSRVAMDYQGEGEGDVEQKGASQS